MFSKKEKKEEGIIMKERKEKQETNGVKEMNEEKK